MLFLKVLGERKIALFTIRANAEDWPIQFLSGLKSALKLGILKLKTAFLLFYKVPFTVD